mmetsp:Transcript_32703/g.55766  ORF Transcript_32703/g.55766 Transcript_32703/m.55766 type:complete len:471 (+) Transcript_32703:61-1473(+)
MMISITLLLIISISWSSIDGFYLPHPSTHRPFRRKEVHHAKSRQIIEQQTDAQEIIKDQQQTTATKKPWIVVVEDEEFLRNAIGNFVSKEGGYHVTGVADARSAFLLCRGIFKPTSNRYTSFRLDPNCNTTDSSFERPDCIVLDVRLGGEMDGIELLNTIRSDVFLESLPVILLTAKGKVDDRIAGYEAGADAYLTKPFDPEELLSVLQGVLRRDVIVSSRSDDQRESSADSKDSTMPMEEIKREIKEIKSLLRQRNNRPESTISDSSALLDGSDAERPSFASMYKDLIEMKEEIKATSNVNVLQPIVDDTAAEQTTIPKVSLEDINEMYFTPDEQKVISLVEKGMTNKEIGEEYMNCSISKVEKIVSSLFKKTGSKRRPQLVTWCKQNLDTEVEQCEDDPKSSRKLNLKEEKEIMDLIGKGFTNNEIVNNLGVSLKDIVTVVDAMLDKAKVSNRTELMRWWNSKESKTS